MEAVDRHSFLCHLQASWCRAVSWHSRSSVNSCKTAVDNLARGSVFATSQDNRRSSYSRVHITVTIQSDVFIDNDAQLHW